MFEKRTTLYVEFGDKKGNTSQYQVPKFENEIDNVANGQQDSC